MGRKSLAEDALSDQARQALEQLGVNLKTARIRRGITQESLAERLSVSRPTISKLEKGSPSVGIGVLVLALELFGMADQLERLAAADADTLGKSLEARTARQRASGKQAAFSIDDDDLDF
ncbi:helix-turn-helix transcriptional regulator [Pseudodesulfovibrio sp.]|uniref:helix-turn-helix transcriptional regulator n=1 Tax=unclassified Pseudodesulfovibrio TaxID=2661612 RepID=UPI003AFF9F74